MMNHGERCGLFGCAVILVGLLLVPMHADASISEGVVGTGSPRLARTKGLYEICISNWAPMVTCSATSIPSGYQVSLFNAIVERLQWSDNSWYYRCMDWTAMIADLQSANGTCFMSAAGLSVTPALMSSGIQFSWPTFKQSLQILLSGTPSGNSVWAVFNAFSWQVWLAMALTSVVAAGASLWVTERIGTHQPVFSYHKTDESIPVGGAEIGHTDSHHVHHFQHKEAVTVAQRRALVADAQARSTGKVGFTFYNVMFWTVTQVPRAGAVTWPGRLIIFSYGLLLAIMVRLYMAQTCAFLTTNEIRTDVTGSSDLVGLRVGTLPDYVPILTNMGISKITSIPWSDHADENAILTQLTSGSLDAMVMDTSFVRYTASKSCSYLAVGTPFNSWSLAFAFPAVTPVADVLAVSLNLVDLQQTSDELDTLEAQFVQLEACKQVKTLEAVTFDQVRALWIFLAVASAICYLMILGNVIRHKILTGRASTSDLDQTQASSQRMMAAPSLQSPLMTADSDSKRAASAATRSVVSLEVER